MADGDYDADAEIESDHAMFDSKIDGEPCWANNFAGYGEGCAIQTSKKYVTLEFVLNVFRELYKSLNIPKTLPRGRVDGWCFITKGEPQFYMRAGQKTLSTDDMNDAHGVYDNKKTNSSKEVHQLNRSTMRFIKRSDLSYDLTTDTFYKTDEVKEGCEKINTKVMVRKVIIAISKQSNDY